MNRFLDILIISENKEESNFLFLILNKSGLNIKSLTETDIKHYKGELNKSFTIILLLIDSFKEKAVDQFINICVNIINIPIVVVSKNNEPEFKTKFLENGAEAFIDIKDINYELFKRELIDAIDRYNYKNRLIHSENSFKLALNSLTSPIVIISEKMSVLYVNPAAEIIFKNYYKDIISTTEKIIKSKNDFTEKVNLKIDNRNFIFDISISQIYWLNQKAYLIELYDRTKEAHYLEEIQKEKEILNKVIDSFPGYIYYKDIEGKYLGSNKLFGEEIFGLSNESLITKTDEELTDYVSDKKLFDINTAILETSEEVLITKDGSKKDFFTFRKTLYDENNMPYSNLTIMFDITAKKIEEKEKNKLLTAINQSLNIIIITDKSGNIEYVNRAFENATLYTLAEIKYKHISIIYQEDSHSEKIQNLLDVLKSRKNWSGEILTKRKDGQLFYQRINITGIYNEKENIENYIVVGEDITEQKKIEKEKDELTKKNGRS